MSMVVHHVQDTAEPPSKHSELDVPSAFDEIVLACLAKSPDERPQSAAELKRMLAELELEDSWDDGDAKKWWAQRG
jgi:serine/threonine-protein kinase